MPNRLETPESTEVSRLVAVSLDRRAVSLMSTLTVRMSPILEARWSWKKARAPERHSELAEAALIVDGCPPSAPMRQIQGSC